MLGIEKSKIVFTQLAITIMVIYEVLKDKKIQWFEWLKLAKAAVNIWRIVKVFMEFKDEVLDYDDQERAELKEHFKNELELENDQAEELFEQIQGVLVDLTNVLESIGKIATKPKVKDWVKNYEKLDIADDEAA